MARPGDAQPVSVLMAQRRAASDIAIFATQICGHACVPINVKQPTRRNAVIIAASGTQRIVVGDLASGCFSSTRLAAAELSDAVEVIECGKRTADFGPDLPLPTAAVLADDWPERVAYILFTSGSTGQPKGVLVPSCSLDAYLSATDALLAVDPGARFSQTFDLTFDLSVYNLSVSLPRKATLVVPFEDDLRSPGSFIRDKALAHWFSVPVLALKMRLKGELEPGAFPRLTSTLFCAEILPAPLALDWVRAAPNSVCETWCGPTEATIAYSHYRIDPANMLEEDAVVPIDRPGKVAYTPWWRQSKATKVWIL